MDKGLKRIAQINTDPKYLMRHMKSAGYSVETIEMILKPMGVRGYGMCDNVIHVIMPSYLVEEALGSMGTDVPLAVLSKNPKLPYDYFKQM